MKKSTTMFDFFKRKDSNSSEVNVRLPTTNVAIPIIENVDIPILENIQKHIHVVLINYQPRQIPKNHCFLIY